MKLRQTAARSSTKNSPEQIISSNKLQRQEKPDSSDSEDDLSFEEIAPFSEDEDYVTNHRSSGSNVKRPCESKASPKVAKKKRENASQSLQKSRSETDLELIIDNAQIDTVKEVLDQLPDHFAEDYCKYLFALQNPDVNKTRQIQYSKPKIVLNDSCIICGRKFSSLRELKKHVIEEHETPDGFYCTSCDKNFKTLTSFNHHVTFIHLIVYPCSYCSLSFQGISDLNEHLSSAHPGKKRFMCTLCNKEFAKSFLLMMHINSHTGLTPHKCDHCPKSYTTTDSLREHVRRHNKDKFQFKCDNCSKVFCSQKLLNVHALTHGTERKFKCNLCEKAFKTHQNLIHHYKTHDPAKRPKRKAKKENKKSVCKRASQTDTESVSSKEENENMEVVVDPLETENMEAVVDPLEMKINKEPLQLEKTIFGGFTMDSDSDSDSDEEESL